LGLPGLPFGAGAAQINNGSGNLLTAGDMSSIPQGRDDRYGDAPAGQSVASVDRPAHRWAWDASNPIAWPASGVGNFFICPPAPGPIPQPLCRIPVVDEWMPNASVKNTNYTGLKPYSDTTAVNDLWGFEGPNIIIALEKKITDLFTPTAPKPVGQFELTESGNTNQVMGAIARGEVYFKRPSDMSLFRRWDTPKTPDSSTLYEEYGSAFNPYWQARLAPLSHADRAVATIQQHGQDMEAGNTTARTITGSWDPETWIR